MQILSKICAIIAGTLMFVTPALLLVWIVCLFTKKSAKKLGNTVLICVGCFIAAVLIGAFSDPVEISENANPTVQTAAGQTESEENQKEVKDTAAQETEQIYSDEVKSFAKKHKISIELSQSFKDAVEQTKFPVAFSDLNGWEKIDDYAFGERYEAWSYNSHEDKYYRLLVYVSMGQVVSLYDVTNGRDLIYTREEEPTIEKPIDGSIRLTDGVLGEYGKEVTIPSKTYGEYTYTWYMVPYGKYTVTNEFKFAAVYVVSDDSSDDVRATLQFNEAGETGELTVEDGTHIELSMKSKILLTPAE